MRLYTQDDEGKLKAFAQTILALTSRIMSSRLFDIKEFTIERIKTAMGLNDTHNSSKTLHFFVFCEEK